MPDWEYEAFVLRWQSLGLDRANVSYLPPLHPSRILLLPGGGGSGMIKSFVF